MASGVNPVFPAPSSVTSTSRSRSSSPQKLGESTYRSRTLFRAGIYVDVVNVPEEVQDRINTALGTRTADTVTLSDLASKLQQKSLKLTAAQAGEADWTSLLHDIMEQLMPSDLLLAQNRDWQPDLKPKVHQPSFPLPSVPRKRLCDQGGGQELGCSQSNMPSDPNPPDPAAQTVRNGGQGELQLDVVPESSPNRLAPASKTASGQAPMTPFLLKTPRPDICVGIADDSLAQALRSRQVANAKYLLNDLQEFRGLVSDPGVTPLYLRFPFCLVEAKSGATGGNLYQAQNQAAVGCASAIGMLKQLYKACEVPLETASGQLLTFSASTEGPVCELWAHFWDEADASYCMANIGIWRTTHKESAFDFIAKLSSILNWGSSTFQNSIVEKLVCLGGHDTQFARAGS
ncbi:uncharacterized protein BO87DRAFT_429823 [Aspergillus neoniger CBS 115656]|uniref:DUF7924 domain-containing protein n=2 Tax=Aspergillus subgen. Circumdati TaxID=2720871 RepID=A0A318YCQ1_ASPNB|nr:hypothetical protein BO87DRAFT_429823 [Aspergillus neoniger CBS 115656]PYH30153.1 hypothetical protein BO87DRAFT_429823 [Aspergillus neoniger CBS 115656]